MKNNRTVRISFRVTPDEHERIKEMSRAFGAVTLLIRTLIFSKKKNIIAPISIRNAVREFNAGANRVGNNINQIAHNLNMMDKNKKITTEQLSEINDNLGEYTKILLELKKKLRDIYLD